MTTSSPPGWYLRPEPWLYWMPSSALSTAPLPSLSAIPLNRSPSAWPESATPFSPSGGILGSFGEPNGAWDADPSSSATQSRGGGGSDESTIPDWLPPPPIWPQWMPHALASGGLVPPAPSEVAARIAFDWEEGPNGLAKTLFATSARDDKGAAERSDRTRPRPAGPRCR